MPDTPAAADTPRTEAGRKALEQYRERKAKEPGIDRLYLVGLDDAIRVLSHVEAAATPQVQPTELLTAWLYSGGMDRPALDKLTSDTERLLDATPQVQADPPAEGLRASIYAAIDAELASAYAKHGSLPWGRHEFYAILLEEVEETWDSIKDDEPLGRVAKEAVQVAAMVIRYLETGDRYQGAFPLAATPAAKPQAE